MFIPCLVQKKASSLCVADEKGLLAGCSPVGLGRTHLLSYPWGTKQPMTTIRSQFCILKTMVRKSLR